MMSALPPALARFVAASPIPITLAEPGRPDRTLIAANAAFCELTRYEEGEIVGRDCRFLQGAATDPQSRVAMRRFFEDDPAAQARISILNYRKDRRPFVNLVFVSKLLSADGGLRYLLASQFDVSHATPDSAAAYDRALAAEIEGLSEVGRAHRVLVETSLASIANSAHAIASAKLALAEIEARAS